MNRDNGFETVIPAKAGIQAWTPASAGVTSMQEPVKPAQDANGIDPKYRAKVQEAAEKFEAFFIAQMLRQMRESTRQMAADDSVFNNRVNQDMLDIADTALADSMSGQRAFGIADAILKQLLPTEAPTRATELKNPATTVATSD